MRNTEALKPYTTHESLNPEILYPEALPMPLPWPLPIHESLNPGIIYPEALHFEALLDLPLPYNTNIGFGI